LGNTDFGEAGLTVAEMDPGQQISDNIVGLWQHVGSLTGAVTTFGLRFDRVDRDIAELKADVRELKTDVAGLKTEAAKPKGEFGPLKEQLSRLEHVIESGFSRMDAQFERLVALIQRDELRKP
jgi:chromosome segregation ATPase